MFIKGVQQYIFTIVKFETSDREIAITSTNCTVHYEYRGSDFDFHYRCSSLDRYNISYHSVEMSIGSIVSSFAVSFLGGQVRSCHGKIDFIS